MFCIDRLLVGLLLAIGVSSSHSVNANIFSLNADEKEDALVQGRSFFHVPWVAAPSSTTARDGLGPLFNANTCVTCHSTTLKARPSLLNQIDAHFYSDNIDSQTWRQRVIKLSQASKHQDRTKNQITTPDPVYGYQIAVSAVASVSPEARPQLLEKEHAFVFHDGYQIKLRSWEVKLHDLAYGELDTKTSTNIRIAPTLMGLKWVEQLPLTNLVHAQQQQAQQYPHLAGQLNKVYNPITQQETWGKFGWKATQANLITQTADAALHDMGLTSIYFPNETCTSSQIDCLQAPKGRYRADEEPFDLTTPRLHAIALYTAELPLPPAIKINNAAALKRGQQLFNAMQCAVCHQAQQRTHRGELFFPYSDFLLHDMGSELADNRPEFTASGQQWRTSPLWRNRYKEHYLHDGRARTLLEAIAWHGGQAEPSREAFRALSETQRQDLILFLESL